MIENCSVQLRRRDGVLRETLEANEDFEAEDYCVRAYCSQMGSVF